MKERPILFSAPMVRAILTGRKTQTRRVVKLPHNNPLGEWERTTFSGTDAHGVEHPEQAAIWHTRTGDTLACPYGQPGERLWVRETFYAFGRWETRFNAKKGRDEWHFVDLTVEAGKSYRYDASMAGDNRRSRHAGATPMWWKRPAIFMPHDASRLTLEVTGVRVERLRDISEADAEAEGPLPSLVGADQENLKWRAGFQTLWESINGAGSWYANPYVWVVEFRRIQKEAIAA